MTGELYVDGSDITIDYDGDEDDEKPPKALIAKDIQLVTIHRLQASNLHNSGDEDNEHKRKEKKNYNPLFCYCSHF